jgi:hypothetical protein
MLIYSEVWYLHGRKPLFFIILLLHSCTHRVLMSLFVKRKNTAWSLWCILTFHIAITVIAHDRAPQNKLYISVSTNLLSFFSYVNFCDIIRREQYYKKKCALLQFLLKIITVDFFTSYILTNYTYTILFT